MSFKLLVLVGAHAVVKCRSVEMNTNGKIELTSYCNMFAVFSLKRKLLRIVEHAYA